MGLLTRGGGFLMSEVPLYHRGRFPCQLVTGRSYVPEKCVRCVDEGQQFGRDGRGSVYMKVNNLMAVNVCPAPLIV